MVDSRGILDCPARASRSTCGVSAGSHLRGATVVSAAASWQDRYGDFMKPSFEPSVNPSSDGRHSKLDSQWVQNPFEYLRCPHVNFARALLGNAFHKAIAFGRYPHGASSVRSIRGGVFASSRPRYLQMLFGGGLVF